MPKENINTIETRAFDAEMRVTKNPEGNPRIEGHAAVFNRKSLDLGGFVEMIAPGTFSRTLKTADVRGLFNHDPNYVLGRSAAKTLRMSEDSKGLLFDNDPPDTQWARDLMVSIERGDISQMSFGFRVVKDQWDEGKRPVLRTLMDVDLMDAGPVTFPAYPQTSVGIRSLCQSLSNIVPVDIDWVNLTDALISPEITDEQRNVIKSAIAKLQGYLGDEGVSPKEGPVQRLVMLRRRLQLVEV